MSEEDEYQVEAIRDWRWNLRIRQRMFLIKWINYDDIDNTWEPESNLNCPDIFRNFKKSLSPAERLVFETSPKKLSGFQRRAVFEGLVGVDGPGLHDLDPDDNKTIIRNNHYCLLQFDDTDQPEEITLEEFFIYQPEVALEFCEQRLINRLAIKPKK